MKERGERLRRGNNSLQLGGEDSSGMSYPPITLSSTQRGALKKVRAIAGKKNGSPPKKKKGQVHRF